MKEYASLYRSRKTFLSSYITLTHLVERAANTNIYTEHNTKKKQKLSRNRTTFLERFSFLNLLILVIFLQ